MAKLLDIFNPIFNLKEVCKEFVLLEDHLVAPGKHCPDCIRKHLLRAEAFAEEAIALDKEGQYKDLLSDLPGQIREVGEEYMSGQVDKHMLGQKVRFIRKGLSPMCFASGGKNISQPKAKPVTNVISSPSWDFWTEVGANVGIPSDQMMAFCEGLKKSADSSMEPYFEFEGVGVSYRVRNSTDWVLEQLTRRLANSTVTRMIQVSSEKGKRYTAKDWEMGIKSALGKSSSPVKFEAPSSSLGEFLDTKSVIKRSYEKAVDLGLFGMLQKARRAERGHTEKHQLLAAKYFEKIGDVSKIDYFWAKSASLYSDIGNSKSEARSLAKIIKVYPDHDLKFWIVNRVSIFDKQEEIADRKDPNRRLKGSLATIIPVGIGFALGLL